MERLIGSEVISEGLAEGEMFEVRHDTWEASQDYVGKEIFLPEDAVRIKSNFSIILTFDC